MGAESRVDRIGDRLRSHLGVAAGVSGVMVTAGAALMWLGNEELSPVVPKPALTSDLWFNLGAASAILAVLLAMSALVAVLLPSRLERIDSQFREQAAALADRLEVWLNTALADDPYPSAVTTQVKTQIHNRLWIMVGVDFNETFGPDLRAFNVELQREQVNRRFDVPVSVSPIHALIRDLRAFSETRGPLSRG
jgi:hypothetical protein